jgi:hypothetical protein
MEKRLYSSGFHIQWNTKGNGSTNNDKVKAPKHPSLKLSTLETVSVSPSVVADCRDLKELTSKDGSGSASMRAALSTDNHRIVKGQATYHTNINSAAVPKPRKGETVEQMAQRKTYKARIYGILALATIILLYPAIVFGIIHSVLKNQVQKLDPNYENVNNGPIPKPGETVEDFAKRKANQSLLFGLLSIPTSVVLFGLILGVLAIVASKDARELAPNNPRIQRRAKAAKFWAIFGFVVFAFVFAWLIMISAADFAF